MRAPCAERRAGFATSILLAVAIAFVLAPGTSLGAVGAARSSDDETPQLAEPFRRWLEEVELLITPRERQAFLDLERDYQRHAFIERFWRQRDPYPDTPRNELESRWSERLAYAREHLGGLEDERAVVYLLNGPPEWSCLIQERYEELWFYTSSDLVERSFFVYFEERFPGQPYIITRPGLSRGAGALGRRQRRPPSDLSRLCQPDQLYAFDRWLERQTAPDLQVLFDRLVTPPEPPSDEWVSSFLAATTEVPKDAGSFPARLTLSYPGRQGGRTVLQGLLAVAPQDAPAGPHGMRNFQLTGEVLRDDRLFEAFRYRFDLPAGGSTEGERERAAGGAQESPAEGAEEASQTSAAPLLALPFQRHVRPGTYRLILRLKDLNAGRFFRHELEIEVPSREGALPAAAEEEPTDELSRLLAEAEAALAENRPLIRLLPPPSGVLAGLQRFSTLLSGEGITRVSFFLDDRRIFTKNRPPYEVELDLGQVPQARMLGVEAYGEAGDRPLATDALVLNPGAQSFRVHLVEPRRGERHRQSLLARVEVDTPGEAPVERVEIFLNETRLATLYQPPFVQPVLLRDGDEVAYVRAVAYLADGNSAEDLVFVNAPDLLSEIDVQLVELYTAVVDRRGQPVDGLEEDRFTVLEDGVEQTVTRFERVRDLPFHLALLLDVSGSMEEGLDTARQAALGFLRATLTPKDRAAILTFNQRPRVAAGLTGDLDTLTNALVGIEAEGGTALYDSLIYSLYYLSGLRGQRAVLLLSDGKDEGSRFDAEETLEYVRRSGVTVYTVGLDLESSGRRTRRLLEEIAEASGGESFFLRDVSQLEEAYGAIERDLRSRYLLVYQSSAGGESKGFRRVEVKVDEPGASARTMQGYYP